MITIHEAYNKGLNDAEDAVIQKVQDILEGKMTPPFANPRLEEVRQRLIEAVSITPIPVDTSPESTPVDNFRGVVRLILMGEENAVNLSTDGRDVSLLEVIQSRSDHYRSIAGGKSRIGKQFKKLVEDQLTLLHSVVN